MKFIFPAVFLLLFNFDGISQGFKAHLLTGFNASQINGDGLAGFDKIGLHAGAGVSRQFAKKWAWQFEIAYAEKGSRDVSTEADPLQDSLFKVNYIEVPLFLNYSVNDRVTVQALAYAGILLNAAFSDYNVEYDRTGDYYETDYGFGGAGEYRFYRDLSVNLKVSQSLVSVNRKSLYYNLVSSLTLRYSFQ